ncbi:Transcription initiation factor TFIID subunit 10 [Turnera subulata]|uniref:Transcription initiation factor TFIID subunit 10 n=1 Tax=Turnera subulata TaxID=218843 RepID=A0A9Q0J7M8_9ROSI|nr:Transcription initiation factor TFIID subunit 10 [Turnera subulata]
MNHHNSSSNSQQSGEARHDDDAALTEFLASLMDYTPTVQNSSLLSSFAHTSSIIISLAPPNHQSFAFYQINHRNRYRQIPDELVEHYLGKSGFQCPDVRLVRLVAVATQKFVAEVASDALQQCKARQGAVVKDKRDKQQKDKRLILTMEDLSKALREYGVNVKHQEYFADSPSTGMDPSSRDE